jgi:hypothetical protein
MAIIAPIIISSIIVSLPFASPSPEGRNLLLQVSPRNHWKFGPLGVGSAGCKLGLLVYLGRAKSQFPVFDFAKFVQATFSKICSASFFGNFWFFCHMIILKIEKNFPESVKNTLIYFRFPS